MADIDPVGFLGREFVGYIAGCDPAVVDEAFANQDHASHHAVTTVVDQCRSLAAPLMVDGVAQALASSHGQGGSVAVAMRREISGIQEEIPQGEQLAEPLAEMVRDIFPAMLIPALPEPQGWRGNHAPPYAFASRGLFEHPARDEFLRRLEADSLIDLIRPEGKTGFFSFASGSGQSIDAANLHLSLIGAAFARARLLDPALTFDGVMKQVARLLADLRAISRSEAIDLPIVVHLQGLEVEPGLKVNLPWGAIRALDQDALKAVGQALMPQGCLFITSVNCFVAAGAATGETTPPDVPSSKFRSFRAELDTKIHKATLALLLSTDDPPVCGISTLSLPITPLFGTGWAAHHNQPDPVVRGQTILTSDHVPSLIEASQLVDHHYAPALEIPTRRLVSALLARHDIEDGLVDAVVALESLFSGTDSGELTFRIGGAVSWLLGRTADERLKLHREIAELYGLRSKILHRGHAGQDVADERDRTVQLTLRAVRALLENHPDLAADENRGKKVIMRGEAPS